MAPPGFYEPPSRTRLWVIPIGSTLVGSALAAVPIVSQIHLLPPFGLMMALAWRLRRHEMWPAWIALPLGLADDLLGGAALGSAMTLWTIAFLAVDAIDSQPTWRDYWLDWRIAAGILLVCGVGQWLIAWFTGGGGLFWPVFPPIVFGILLFPAAARFCALLDRWRLAR